MVQGKRTREPCQSGRIGLKGNSKRRWSRGCFINQISQRSTWLLYTYTGKSQPADTPWGTLLHPCCKMRSQTTGALQKKEFSRECCTLIINKNLNLLTLTPQPVSPTSYRFIAQDLEATCHSEVQERRENCFRRDAGPEGSELDLFLAGGFWEENKGRTATMVN